MTITCTCRAVESVADTIVIVTEEIEEIQDCQGSVLVQYLSSIGLWRVLASVLAVLAGQVVWIISEWWLTAWAQSSVDSQSGEFLKWLGAFSALVAGVSHCNVCLLYRLVIRDAG